VRLPAYDPARPETTQPRALVALSVSWPKI
jgi:hypothetical protein